MSSLSTGDRMRRPKGDRWMLSYQIDTFETVMQLAMEGCKLHSRNKWRTLLPHWSHLVGHLHYDGAFRKSGCSLPLGIMHPSPVPKPFCCLVCFRDPALLSA